MKNLNGYYVGSKISNWHSLVALFMGLVPWIIVGFILLVITFIATLSFWV